MNNGIGFSFSGLRCVRSGLRVGRRHLPVQSAAQRVAGAREPGHDGAQRNAQRIGHLLIRQAFQFAADDQFARPIGQVLHRALDCRARIRSKQQRLQIGGGRIPGVIPLVERLEAALSRSGLRVAAGVADDPQEPGPAVAAGERPEVPKRAERRLLYGVLRILLVPHQPAGEPVGSIQMGQNDIVEAFASSRRRVRGRYIGVEMLSRTHEIPPSPDSCRQPREQSERCGRRRTPTEPVRWSYGGLPYEAVR